MLRKLMHIREWLRAPDDVEEAGWKEVLKRDAWMFASTTVTFAIVAAIIATAGGVAYGQFGTGSIPSVYPYVLAGSSLVLSFYIDGRYVFPWGVERFDITIPWQFREVENGE